MRAHSPLSLAVAVRGETTLSACPSARLRPFSCHPALLRASRQAHAALSSARAAVAAAAVWALRRADVVRVAVQRGQAAPVASQAARRAARPRVAAAVASPAPGEQLAPG